MRPVRSTDFLCEGQKEEETDLAMEAISLLHAMLDFGDVVLLERDEVETAVWGEKILGVTPQTNKSISGRTVETEI